MNQFLKSTLILLGLLLVSSAQAFRWNDLWQTPNQQAQALFDQSQYQKASEQFSDPDWKAAALFRAGNYEQAATQFSTQQTPDGFYNAGNALAHQGQYEKAIKAYDQTLALDPTHDDAIHNRKILEDLLKKDKDKQEKENKENQDQEKDQNKDQGKPQDKPQDKPKDSPSDKPAEQKPTPSREAQEEQHANEQWLQLVPDDPGGLLRQKFLRDHLRRQRGWYP